VNQSLTFDIVDIADLSLFVDRSTPVQIAPDGTVTVNCSVAQRSAGVTAVDVVLRDDGGTRPVQFAGALEPGLVWDEVNLTEPTLTTLIRNEALEKALQGGSREFRSQELKTFGLSELSFGSYIAVGDIYFKPSTPVQLLVCASTASVAPACQVSFRGLPAPPSNVYQAYPSPAAYTGIIVRVSVANTDFSEADEQVTAVWIGNQRLTARPGGDHFMTDGHDNRCTKMDKIIDMWLPMDSPAFARANGTHGGVSAGQELTVRIETSDAVGCCFCNGASLYAEVTLIPYTVPDDQSLRTTLDMWIVSKRREPSIDIPLVLTAVEQERQPDEAGPFALLRVDDFVSSADSGVDLASDELWNFTITVDLEGNSRLVPHRVTLSAGSGSASAGAAGASWSLVVPLGWGEIGNADISVAASVLVSRGERFNPQLFHMPTARKCRLRVLPRPRLMSVEPCVGAVQGGTLVTLHGFHLKLFSPSDTIRVWFGEGECHNVSLLVSTSNGAAATCITPPAHHIWQRDGDMLADTAPAPGAMSFADDAAGGRAHQGAGLINVSIAFADTSGNHTERIVGERQRQATLGSGFRYWLLLLATTAHKTSHGLLSALSPHNLPGPTSSLAYSNASSGSSRHSISSPQGSEQQLDYFPAANATNVWSTGLQTSTAISALAVWRHRIIVAGTFSRVQAPFPSELADKTHHIAAFDGRAPSALGLGLNGPVHTLASFAGKLVVGGAFARAFQASSSPLHVKGGLATWDGSSWGLLGGAEVAGSVDSCLAVGSFLYVAGVYDTVGGLPAGGLAVFDDKTSSWSAHMGGVHGGAVRAMTWWRNSLVLAGSFTKVGGRPGNDGLAVTGLALWEDGVWKSLGHVDGGVWALASSPDSLYLAGSFSTLDGQLSPLLGVFRNGKLAPISASGVAPISGSVLALAYVWETRCLLVGGDYNDLAYDPAQGYTMAPKSSKPGSNLRRLCRVPARGASNNGTSFDVATQLEWEDVDGPGETGMGEPIKDPVKLLLSFNYVSTLDGGSREPESSTCLP